MDYEKNSKTRLHTLRIAALAGVMLAGVPLAVAQDDEEDEQVFELSPFVVDVSGDYGYTANNTLSGTRLNTENRYVGASVTVITHQLLEDLAIDDFEDVLDYVPNSAPAESGGLASDITGNEQIFGVRYRVRGFLLTGFSRDFFTTRVAPDSYNTDRMTFSRGPNSVLFGIAEPGGVTNAVSARAQFANRNQVGVRFDTWDSARYHGSFNREVIDDMLAVRVAHMYNDHRSHRKPWHNKSERTYGALTFKPFKNTTFRAHYETGDAERLNVRSWAPGDAITLWLAAGSRDIPNDPDDPILGDRLNPLERSTPAQRQILLEDYGLQESRPQATWPVLTSGFVDQSMFYSHGREFRTAQNRVPGIGSNSNTERSFTDDSIIPLTANVLGSGNKNKQEFSNSSLFLEQKITDNLFIELAYNRQDTDNQPDFSTGARDSVYLDIMPTLRLINPENPRAIATGEDSIVPNPNYGKYYTFNDTPTTFDEIYDDETVRAMVSYELDLRDRFDGRLGTFLGRHNLAAMYETYDAGYMHLYYHFRNAMRRPDLKPGQGLWISLQNYIDPVSGQFDSLDIAHMAPRVWLENMEDLPEGNPSGVAPFWYGIVGRRTWTETTSEMFAMQNFFWDNKIVTTFGWRSDDVDSWAIINNPSNRDPDTFLVSNPSLVHPKSVVDEPASTGGNTNSRGIVITPIPWLGFFYNESSNFRPSNADAVDIFGNPIGNEEGEGKDYGLKFHLMDGKLTGSFAFFETSFLNQVTVGPRQGPVAPFDQPRSQSKNAINEYYEDLAEADPTNADLYAQQAAVYDEYGYFNTFYKATQDFSSEGWELSLTANPTRNWRVTFNLSKQENVSTNVAPKMQEWAKHIRTVLTDPVLLDLETNALKPDGVTYYTVADNLDRSDQRIVEIASLEGFADQRQPEMSANLVTAYDFKDGPLKGFTFGGSVRWRDQAAVGYQLKDDGSGALDATRPYWNESTEWVGVFVTYRRKLPHDINMRLQLNIDNLFDDERGNPILSRDVNGQRMDSRLTLPEGRSFALTATFDF
jgi:outer membrane receptor for ferric coprogen and ferric-rhodotorulic acid